MITMMTNRSRSNSSTSATTASTEYKRLSSGSKNLILPPPPSPMGEESLIVATTNAPPNAKSNLSSCSSNYSSNSSALSSASSFASTNTSNQNDSKNMTDGGGGGGASSDPGGLNLDTLIKSDSSECGKQLLANSSSISSSDRTDSPLRKAYGSVKDVGYKQQKEIYLVEKKKITNDILTIMRDERIIILADWLKIRGSFKNWIKLYIICKPGMLQLFKSDNIKPGQWVGTVLLNSCKLMKRPSKKHGFCFKLFHPLERSIWASKGPTGETYINLPYMLLPTFYLIFRAPSERVGNIWMEAIELALLKANNLTTTPIPEASLASNNTITSLNSLCDESMSKSKRTDSLPSENGNINHKEARTSRISSRLRIKEENNKNSSGGRSLNSSIANEDEDGEDEESDDDDDDEIDQEDLFFDNVRDKCEFEPADAETAVNSDDPPETRYEPSESEEFGQVQTEEVGEENKSLILCLVKQVRPGMDLSKVVLPTFILEPRSFLEKFSDYYYHSDLLTECAACDDPYERMKLVVKFYLSGFYKKPKGLKKPYNPVLGEVFRTYWINPVTGAKTFYIAEQVSHHPPITAFYVTNRQEGYCVSGTILARSKFYGNSVSAIMDGCVRINLLNRGEEYVVTLPYANCKGILLGKMTMELGGKVKLECAKTGYSADIEFKLKPLLSGGNEATNQIDGKIKFANKETMAVFKGKWDGEILMYERGLAESSNAGQRFWLPNKEVIDKRLKRFVVPLNEQADFESEKVWFGVSEAIRAGDQYLATEEKSKIEAKQRTELSNKQSLLERSFTGKFFTYDALIKEWVYNYSDLRPWDPQTDLYQYESEFKIFTKTRIHLNKLTKKSDLILPTTHLTRSDAILESQCATSSSFIIKSDNSNNSALDLICKQFENLTHRLDKLDASLSKLNSKLDANSRIFQASQVGKSQSSAFHQLAGGNNLEINQSNVLFFLLIAFFVYLLYSVIHKYI